MFKKKVFRNYYPALLLFLGLSLFTFYTYYELNNSLEARTQKLFEQRVSRVHEELHNRINGYIQILKGCQALFYASNEVNSKMWKTYVDNLHLSENYPGIQAVAFAAMINKANIPQLEAQIKATGFPNFKVTSTFKNQRLTPIIYIEPFTGRNLRAFGFDMYSEAKRRAAMNRAMISGQPAITSKVTLVQETNNNIQPGFLLYLPVYRSPESIKTVNDRKENIIGFVYNPFRSHDFMNATLQSYSDLNIEVYNGKIADKESLLYSSSTKKTAKQANKKNLLSNNIISIAGTQWRVIATPTETFGSSIERREPILALLLGLAITFLMSLISISIIRNKSRALEELMLSKEIEKKKDEFIGIAAHELKTPLTSINAYTQLLARADLKENEKKLLYKTSTQIKKLSLLISDLLDVSKINAGALRFNSNEFKLSELITESIESVSHMYKSHQIVLSSTIPDVQIKGDKLRLEQAITNLLVNAVKYSPSADNVYLNVTQQPSIVSIEIRDEGIGISEKDRKRIFEKFYRAEELSPYLSGLGMGLYIANQIVTRHKGTITVNSVPGKGSVFSIMLPIDEEKTAS
ncbi:MAG: CHASE domain-containing sensor histidine kinase [Sphingobacteriaceae bacterium]